MAGGMGSNPKKNQFGKTSVLSNETIKDHGFRGTEPKVKLQGIFNLGQTIEFGNQEKTKPKTENVWSGYINQEIKASSQDHQVEVKRAIEELRNELKNLILTTKEISHDIESITVQEQIDFNEYQLNFLQRIKTFIINFRQNISDASIWMDTCSKKNKKKNAFWNKAKDKKTGGEQYMFSNEHSASRSIN